MSRKRELEIEESLDFLRQRFDEVNSDIKLPHSLSADMLRYKLENLDLQTDAPRKNIRWKPIMGVAACFVVGFVSIFALNSGRGSTVEQTVSSSAAADVAAAGSAVPAAQGADGVLYADSYTGIRDMIFDMNGGLEAYAVASDIDEGALPSETGEILMSAPEAEDAQAPAAASGAPAPQTADAPRVKAAPAPDGVDTAPVPQTAGEPLEESAPVPDDVNLKSDPAPQSAGEPVEGSVSAQDGGMAGDGRSAMPAGYAFEGENGAEYVNGMLETDGGYVYSYVEDNGVPTMYISKAGDKSPMSKIPLTSGITAFYADGNRLVTIGDGKSIPQEALPSDTIVGATDDLLFRKLDTKNDTENGWYMGAAVEATVYDVSDRSQPKLVKTFMQDGSYTNSCVRDGVLYLVTSRPVWPKLDSKDTPMSDLVPVTFDGSEAKASLLPAQNITMAQGSRMSGYAVATALELSSGDASTQAVLGVGDGVRISEDNIYVYYSVDSTVSSYDSTGIIRFGMDGKKLSLEGSMEVAGIVTGLSAFGEDVGGNGNLAVVSTVHNPSGGSATEVTVFDGNLKQLGNIGNIAENEYVSTVYYAGDTAYIVTVSDNEPVFAVDLSASESPKLLGRLELSGAWDIMQQVDDSTVIGLSRVIDANGLNAEIKISLLDISEPVRPRELYSESISGSGIESDMFFDKDKLLFDGRSVVAFPVTRYNSDGSGKTEYAAYSCTRDAGIKSLGSVDGACAGAFNGRELYLQTKAGVTAYDIASTLAPKIETMFKA